MSSADKRLWAVAATLLLAIVVVIGWAVWPDSNDSGGSSGSAAEQSEEPDSAQPRASEPPGDKEPRKSAPPNDPRAQQPPSAPKLPSKIDEKSAAGAREAIEYYYDALAFLHATGDGDPYRRVINTEQCPECGDILSMFEQLWRDGGWVRGGDYEVTNIAELDVTHPTRNTMAYFASVTVNREPFQIHDAQQGSTSSSEAFTEVVTIVLHFDGKKWTIKSV